MTETRNKLKHIDLIQEFLLLEIEKYFSTSSRAMDFWKTLKESTECYVFGGFIVDYLNRKLSHRDIDFVVREISPEIIKMIEIYDGIKNSFGGYKIKIDNIMVDLWALKDTWAIRQLNFMDLDLIDILPSTSFFNSTAIIFSINDQKLKYHKAFLDYLNKNTLDILFVENPYPELCLVKTYQLVKSQKLKLSDKLLDYVFDNFKNHIDSINEIQIKHYGEVKFPDSELNKFYNELISYSNNSKSDNTEKNTSNIENDNEDQLKLF